MNLSLAVLFQSMGLFAKGIVLVMAVMSIYSLSIAFGKWWNIFKNQKATRKFVPLFSRALQEEKLKDAAKLAEKNQGSHVGRVLGHALAEVEPMLSYRDNIETGDVNSMERAIEREMLITITEFKRGLGVLATVGSTAPFVGLLGTTMGIVNAFTGMAAAGASGGLAGLSAGIAEALITTAFGLMVAIPAVWLYNYFATKIENLTVELTYSSKELIDFLIQRVGVTIDSSGMFTKEFKAQKAVTGSGHLNG